MKLFDKNKSNILLILSLTTAVGIILIIGISSTVNYFLVKRGMMEQYYQQMNDQSNSFRDYMRHHMEVMTGIAAGIARDSGIAELVENNELETLRARFTDVVSKDPNVENLFLATAGYQGKTGGEVLVDGIGNKSKGMVIGVNDAYSRTMGQSMNGKISQSAVSRSPVSGETVVLITAPVIEEDKVLAIIGYATVLDDIMFKMVSEIRVGKTGCFAFQTLDGVLISHPTFTKPWTNDNRPWKKDMKKFKSIWQAMANAKEGELYQFKARGSIRVGLKKELPDLGILLAVSYTLSEMNQSIRNILLFSGGLSVILGLLSIIAIIAIISRMLNKYLGEDPMVLQQIVGSIAEGNLKIHFKPDDAKLSGVYAGLKQMTMNLTHMFMKISEGVETLTAASSELHTVARALSDGTEQASEKSGQVTGAAQGMATQMETVAAATEQAANNIQVVVAASEEMASSINEIAENTVKGAEITSQAVKNAEYVTQKVALLDQAATQISKVTDTIADISNQTHLLALNATIEAARAGSAGKGFSVVAAEIKDLAQQTAGATDDINQRLQEVQVTSRESIEAIRSIVETINEINSIVNAVSTAVEEQSVTTREIAGNIAQAGLGVEEVSSNISLTSESTRGVTSDISKVSSINEDIKMDSKKIDISAKNLSQLAGNIHALIGRFKFTALP